MRLFRRRPRPARLALEPGRLVELEHPSGVTMVVMAAHYGPRGNVTVELLDEKVWIELYRVRGS